MAMRRRSSAWRDVHIDEAEALRSVFSRKKDGVSISDESNVRKAFLNVWLSNCQGTV